MGKIDIDKFVEHLMKWNALDINAVQSALYEQGLTCRDFKIQKITSTEKDTVDIEELERGTTMTKLEVAATKFAEKNYLWLRDALPTLAAAKSFIKGAEWRNNNLWHDAQGDDLPEIDREVIVLTQSYPLEGSEYAVRFAHRPVESYTGVSIINHSEMEEYYPERYGKGGWSIPDVKYWLDVIFPNE